MAGRGAMRRVEDPALSHPVRPRWHQFTRDVIRAVLGGIQITADVVESVPPHDVVARGESRIADQIPNANAVGVLDNERDRRWRVEFKTNRNRRVIGIGGNSDAGSEEKDEKGESKSRCHFTSPMNVTESYSTFS